jgi:hypothetical protein
VTEGVDQGHLLYGADHPEVCSNVDPFGHCTSRHR